ncbi:M23 family metallopeptidase [Nocardioides currus]|uniref:M23ase beta-sheet core domain-containing protein n=1 Tax=Nocardioides currus TaxID=2133958 RepID=A0A2R7YSF7_9ACTN|nr:M23 family metallopeptidase [Nocardioides currus]PUA79243.1 hypothetical protein C7S10_19615 [Nocardioides currus]
MTRRRRWPAALALLAAMVAPALVGTAAHASPETPRALKMHDELMVEVELHVQHREEVLTALLDAAERHAADVGQRSARLAALGYTGDLTKLEYVLPVQDYRLTAGFGESGPHWASVHTGLDFAAPLGTELVAVADGIVTEVAYAGPYGIRTVLTLQDGTEVWYNHQLQPLVFEGQAILIGEPIGLLGTTGNSIGPHLHLEVRPGGAAPVDPRAWLTERGLTP